MVLYGYDVISLLYDGGLSATASATAATAATATTHTASATTHATT